MFAFSGGDLLLPLLLLLARQVSGIRDFLGTRPVKRSLNCRTLTSEGDFLFVAICSISCLLYVRLMLVFKYC